MPYFAYVKHLMTCPNCDEVLFDNATLSWGYCPYKRMGMDNTYQIGDPIRWKRCSDGQIHSWTYFHDQQGKTRNDLGGNIGTTDVSDIIVTDQWGFGQNILPSNPWNCRNCQFALGGTAVTIRAGVIEAARIYAITEFTDQLSYYLISSTGEMISVPEWKDHGMEFRDC